MWQLMVTNAAREWVADGSFDTVTAAARRIREIEGRATGGYFSACTLKSTLAATTRLSAIWNTQASALSTSSTPDDVTMTARHVTTNRWAKAPKVPI